MLGTFLASVFLLALLAAGIVKAKNQWGGTTITGGKKMITLKPGVVVISGRIHPLAGAQAQAIAGGKQKRLVVGTLPVPALVVTGPTWAETVEFRSIGHATLAARRINEAAAQA